MNDLSFWNHNSAYYPWIRRKVGGRTKILDVGCGEGALARYLSADGTQVTGIDPSPDCIERSRAATPDGVHFACSTFEDFTTRDRTWDAVIFAASLHHMDTTQALRKAKELLRPGGMLIVVGLATPDRLSDWLIECARVLPCQIGSFFHRMTTSEQLGVPTSYALPGMSSVRAVVQKELPGARLRHGLYYRYLLSWVKPKGN